MIPVFILGLPPQTLLDFFNSEAFQVYVLENIRNPSRIPNSILPTSGKYIVIPSGAIPQTSAPTLKHLVENLPSKYPLVLLSIQDPNWIPTRGISGTHFQIGSVSTQFTTKDTYIRQPGTPKETFRISPPLFSPSQESSNEFDWKALFVLILVGFLMLSIMIIMVKSQKHCDQEDSVISSPSSPEKISTTQPK